MSVFVYGSLLNPDELEKQFGSSVKSEKVTLNGFKRHYGQLSDFRTDKYGKYGNVLTVTEKKGFSCNGVLVYDISDEQLADLKERESGYRLQSVNSEKLEFYEKEIETDSFFVSVGEKQTCDWNPLPGYMETCEKGAGAWGEKFYEVFRKSTYKFADSNERPHI